MMDHVIVCCDSDVCVCVCVCACVGHGDLVDHLCACAGHCDFIDHCFVCVGCVIWWITCSQSEADGIADDAHLAAFPTLVLHGGIGQVQPPMQRCDVPWSGVQPLLRVACLIFIARTCIAFLLVKVYVCFVRRSLDVGRVPGGGVAVWP